MRIKVHLADVLAYYAANQSVVEVDGNTLMECLKCLTEKYPEIKKLVENAEVGHHIRIAINRQAETSDLSTPVKEGDVLSVTLHVG